MPKFFFLHYKTHARPQAAVNICELSEHDNNDDIEEYNKYVIAALQVTF